MSRRYLPLALFLTGCPAPAGTDAPAAPQPTILVTYASPTPVVASAAPDPAASPSLAPTPAPSPTPLRVESASFFFTRPATWALTAQTTEPERVELRAADGNAAFVVATLPASTLADRRAAAVREAGAGLVANTGVTLDQVTGYYVTSNRDDAEGKRYHVEYGFSYRGRIFTLHASWDKRLPGADTANTDLQALVKTFRWL